MEMVLVGISVVVAAISIEPTRVREEETGQSEKEEDST